MDERKQREKRQFWKGLAVGIVIMLVVMEAMVFGRQMLNLAQKKAGASGSLGLTNSEVQKKLEEMQKLIELYYLDEIDPEQVKNYLFKGTVAGLGDTYAAYYTQEEYQSMLDSTYGSYCGIGVEISQNMSTGIITIVRIFEGSPAMEAGLLPGDILYQVDGVEVTGEDLTKVVSLIKGEEHTTTLISVVREGEKDYLEFETERRTIEVPTVSHEMLEGQVGYIAITSFDDVTTEQFLQAMDDLEP